MKVYKWRVAGDDTWHSLYDGLWQKDHGTIFWGGRKETRGLSARCAHCSQALVAPEFVTYYSSYPYVRKEARFYCFDHSPISIEFQDPCVTYRGTLRLKERGVLELESEEGSREILAALVRQHIAERGAWLTVHCAINTRQQPPREVGPHLAVEGPSGADYCVYRQIPGSCEPQRIDELWNVDGRDVLRWLKQWPGYTLTMTVTYAPEIEPHPSLRYRLVDARRDGILWVLVNTRPHQEIGSYWVENFREGQAECNLLNQAESERSLSSVLDEVASILRAVKDYQSDQSNA